MGQPQTEKDPERMGSARYVGVLELRAGRVSGPNITIKTRSTDHLSCAGRWYKMPFWPLLTIPANLQEGNIISTNLQMRNLTLKLT